VKPSKPRTKAVTVLAADFDTLSASQKDDILRKTGVTVTIRIIPASAIDEIKTRIETARLNPDVPYESMAIPAFYAPLSIRLTPSVKGRRVRLALDRCEIDIQSFLASQRPATLKKVTDSMTPAQKKKVLAEQEQVGRAQEELDKWLAKATTWQKFIDFWAVDWDYGSRVDPDGKPIFETDWQSFRERRGKDIAPLSFAADLEYDPTWPLPGRRSGDRRVRQRRHRVRRDRGEVMADATMTTSAWSGRTRSSRWSGARSTAWRGFALGAARDPSPMRRRATSPKRTGEREVSDTSMHACSSIGSAASPT
jgi:hypothetical protein